MTKFILEIVSSKESLDSNSYYQSTVQHPVTPSEIYKAISEHLRVQGYETSVVSVTEDTKVVEEGL